MIWVATSIYTALYVMDRPPFATNAIYVVFAASLCVWVWQLVFSTTRIPCMPDVYNLAIIITLAHPLLHYGMLGNTYVDSVWHFFQLMFHTYYFRKVLPISMKVYGLIYIVYFFIELPKANDWSAELWGEWMMEWSSLPGTFVLTLDGIVGPLMNMRLHTTKGNLPMNEAGVLWLVGIIMSVGYLLAIDGPGFGLVPKYHMYVEYIYLALLLVVMEATKGPPIKSTTQEDARLPTLLAMASTSKGAGMLSGTLRHETSYKITEVGTSWFNQG